MRNKQKKIKMQKSSKKKKKKVHKLSFDYSKNMKNEHLWINKHLWLHNS